MGAIQYLYLPVFLSLYLCLSVHIFASHRGQECHEPEVGVRARAHDASVRVRKLRSRQTNVGRGCTRRPKVCKSDSLAKQGTRYRYLRGLREHRRGRARVQHDRRGISGILPMIHHAKLGASLLLMLIAIRIAIARDPATAARYRSHDDNASTDPLVPHLTLLTPVQTPALYSMPWTIITRGPITSRARNSPPNGTVCRRRSMGYNACVLQGVPRPYSGLS